MRLMVAAVLCCGLTAGQEFSLGSRVAGFSVEDLSGAPVSFPDPRGSVTVVAFISTLCPVSNGFNDRMTALFRAYSTKGITFVFIDSNANESAADVAAHRKSAGFPFAVYKDRANRVADRFGAMATPETYVIDGSGLLRYHGYIEDSINEARVKNRALRTALDAILAGKPVPVAETKSFGCSIKRVRRSSS